MYVLLYPKATDGGVLMGAPIGNQNGVGHGRPRQLGTELSRLRTAAGHLDQLLEQHAISDLLMDRKTAPPPELVRERNRLQGELVDLEHCVQRIELLTSGDWSAPRRSGKRRRALGADPYTALVMQAARALDRLVPDEEQPQ
jgi:hypothetical protein